VNDFPVVASVFRTVLETGSIPPPATRPQPHSTLARLERAFSVTPMHYGAIFKGFSDGGSAAAGRMEFVVNYDMSSSRGTEFGTGVLMQVAADCSAIAARFCLHCMECSSAINSTPVHGSAFVMPYAMLPARLVSDLKSAIMAALFKIAELVVFRQRMRLSLTGSSPASRVEGDRLSPAHRELLAWLFVTASALLTNKLPKNCFALQQYGLVGGYCWFLSRSKMPCL